MRHPEASASSVQLAFSCPSLLLADCLKRGQDVFAIEERDLLILRLPCVGISIEPEPSQRVVEERTPHLDLRLAAPHPVIECDDLGLRLREVRVGADLQGDLGMPVAIIVG